MGQPGRYTHRSIGSFVTVKTPVTITYLEMTQEPPLALHPPANIGRLGLMRATDMPVAYYRYLFDQVGRPWKWFSRWLLSDDELKAIIHDEAVEIFVLYLNGSPAGYFEIDFRSAPDVEILFIGLIGDSVGRGLGKFLLASAIQRAWQGQDEKRRPGPTTTRVHLQTCTLDHPRALNFYQKMGFTPFSQEETVLEIPKIFLD